MRSATLRIFFNAVLLMANVGRADALFFELLCFIPFLNLLFSFCGDGPTPSPESPTEAPVGLIIPPAPAPGPAPAPNPAPKVQVRVTTGTIANAASNASPRIKFFPSIIGQTATFALTDLPAPGITKTYSFDLPENFEGISIVELDADDGEPSSTDGWFVSAMSVQFESDPVLEMDLKDPNPFGDPGAGIWLDGAPYNFPSDYLDFRYSDRWEFFDDGSSQSHECRFPNPVSKLQLVFRTGMEISNSFSSMDPKVTVYPAGGGVAASYPLLAVPAAGPSQIYNLNIVQNWCGVHPEIYLLATSRDGWLITEWTAQIDDGPVERIVTYFPTPGKESGIWLDGKPYNVDADYGTGNPWSNGWVGNIVDGGYPDRRELP